MTFISPALISRIYQALGRNRGSHAILLLRQHSIAALARHDNDLMPLIVNVADECLIGGDLSRAEEHYKLGLALYESCFCDRPTEALRCFSGLLIICERQHRTTEYARLLDIMDTVTEAVRGRISSTAQAV